jgi:hypothetical protein
MEPFARCTSNCVQRISGSAVVAVAVVAAVVSDMFGVVSWCYKQ